MLHRTLTLTLLLLVVPVAVSAAGIPMVGQVLGPDGKPGEKVTVRLQPILPTYERAVLRLEGNAGPEPVATMRTGDDGTFEIEAPEAGMWKVVVSAPKMLTAELRLLPLVEATVLPPFQLTPAADLEVRLVDVEGKPRPGAVGAVALGVRGPWRPLLRLARAGEDGVAHLPLGKGEKIQLEVLGDGHPLKVFELFDETSVTIDLPAGAARTVRVTDQQKRPLAGAVAFQGSALLPLGLSDEEGRLSLVLQKEKRPAVRVSTADRWNGAFELDPATDGGKVKDLKLDPPETLSGRVLDLSNRDPVAGALVWAVRGELAMTDEQGRYELDDGVYKSRFVQASAVGYQPGRSQRRKDDAGDVPVIGLTPAAGLSGRVVDREGALLAGVTIELALGEQRGFSSAAHRMMRDGWHGRTSERGAFRVNGLPTGVEYRLTFRRPGFAPGTLDVPPLEPFESRTGLKVVLEPGRLAFGRVVDEDDLPVAGAEIRLAEPPTGDAMEAMRRMRWNREEPDEPSHLTDGEGRFEVTDLEAGHYDLEVRAAGFAPARVPGVQVSEAEARTDFGTVVLVPGASIEGRVTDPDGGAIEDAEVTVEFGRRGLMMAPPSDPPESVKTDAKGRFVVADLLPGQAVTLMVSKAGYGTEAVASLSPPLDQPLAIVLDAAGRIKGRVVDRQGEPIRMATVMVRPDFRAMTPGKMMRPRGRRSAWDRTGVDGAFLIEDAEPGILQLTADADGYQQQTRTGIELEAGAELEFELVLDAGAVVEGTVTTADGAPLVQASVSVSEPMEGFTGGNLISAGSQTDVEGRYRVTGAPIGPAAISVHHGGGEVQMSKNIEVEPGTNVVDLVLERGYEISGQVVTPDGTPAPGASLSVQPVMQPGVMRHSMGGTPQARSRGDGTFTLKGVKAGRYMVSVSREGYAPASSETLEVSGDVTGLLLELTRGATLRGRIVGLDFDELGALSLAAYGQGGMRHGQVDFEGQYAFEHLAPGQWHLQAQVASSGRSAMLQIEIPEGTPEVVKDIEFGTGFALTGVVIDGDQPVAGVNVTASGTAGSSGFAMTGDDGRFRIENLMAGSYQVMIMAGMGVQFAEAIELASDHELRIEISTGTVTGLIRDAAGEPLAGAVVTLEQLDAGSSSAVRQFSFGNRAESDSRGYFRVPQVRQGNWRLIATKAGYAPGETTVVVAGGGAPEVEIRLTPTEGVTFMVVLESGLAIPAVQVTLLDAASRSLASANHPVIDGKVRVSTVPPGRWDLVIQGGDSASTRVTVSAPGDQGHFVLPIGGTLHVKVPELESVPMASVKLTGPDGKPFVSSMGVAYGPGEWMLSGGQTMVPALVPGVWSFTVSHDGRTWSGSAAVTPGATTEVSVP